jgi:hypothetical protein
MFTFFVWMGKTGILEADIVQDKKYNMKCLDGKIGNVIGMQ